MKFVKLFYVLLLFFAAAVSGAPAAIIAAPLAAAAQKQERQLGPGARLGLAVLRPNGAVAARWRGNERFPLASTHKALLCAALLHQADIGALNLNEQIRVKADKAAGYAPIIAKFAGRPMSLRRLCAAAVSHSDNAAANLISARLGGPSATTRFLRQIGDKTTRLDRYEPALNSAIPGDKRDTTAPLAVSESLRLLLAGPALKPQSRQLLAQWLREDAVADSLLRAALPKGWVIADKSGAGGHGTRAIIAAVWPQPKDKAAVTSAPWIIALYMTETAAPMAERDKAIAQLGPIIFSAIAQQPQ